jgi:hypothetical protein
LGASFAPDDVVIGILAVFVELGSNWFVKEKLGLFGGFGTELLVKPEELLILRLVVIAGLND